MMEYGQKLFYMTTRSSYLLHTSVPDTVDFHRSGQLKTRATLQANVLQERGSLLELVDPDLGSAYSSEEAMVMLNVALLCTNASPTLRPTMSQVVSMLDGRTAVQDLLSDPGFSAVDAKYRAIRNHFWQNPSRTHSMSTDGPCTDSKDTDHLIRFGSIRSDID